MAGSTDDYAASPGSGNPLPASPTPVSVEALRFGRYEVLLKEGGVLFELGRGGMGVTYKARDPELGRVVVLKVISAQLLGHDPQARARFRREARSAAGIHHPHIATVFDIGEERGEDYYVMEFIAGEDLLTRLKRDGPLPAQAALRVARQVAEALGAAWEQGIIHRDIKPSNLMVVRRAAERDAREGPLVKVVDFGLAKALKVAADSTTTATMSSGRSVFSAAYASPEQIEEGELDVRSDLYSLGVTIWQSLVGQPTFGETSYQKAIVGHLSKPPPFEELRAAQVPEPFIAVLEKLLQKLPDDRLPTPEALIDELATAERRLLDGNFSLSPPPPPRPPPPPPLPNTVSAADLLRQRGTLPIDDVLRLLDKLAPAVDEARRVDDPRAPDLDPAHVLFRFTTPPASLTGLMSSPVAGWPPFTVEFRRPPGTAPDTSLGTTMPIPRPEGDAMLRLASLVYELLAGQWPHLGRYRPLALNEAANTVLQRGLLDGGDERFRSATDFATALRAVASHGSGLGSAAMPPPPLTPPAPPAFPTPPRDAAQSTPPLQPPPFPQQQAFPPIPLPPRPPTRPWLIPAVIGAVVLIGLGIFFAVRPPKPPPPPEPTPAPIATPRPTAAPTATPRPRSTPTPSPSPALWLGAKEVADGRAALARGESIARSDPKEFNLAQAEYETALTAFQEALRKDPNSSEAKAGLEQIRKIATDYAVKGYAAEKNDATLAVSYYRVAAALGNSTAQSNLGLMYEYGRGGVARDEVKATELYRKSADQGNASGQAYLATMYEAGRGGVPKNEVLAVELYRKAADARNAFAQTCLAVMYEQGRGGLPKDDEKAVELYQKAAASGNARAQTYLGLMYSQGRGGLLKDEAKAVELYMKGAEGGNAQAQVNLGIAYENGKGGLFKDEVKAVELYRKASENGNAAGTAYLAEMYEHGRGGLMKNEIVAVSLYRKAAAQGNDYAKNALQRLGKLP